MHIHRNNFCLLADAYKETHWKQYPPDTQVVYSYLESRGGEFDATLFYGLQMLIKKHFEGPVLEQWMIEDADQELGEVFSTHALFNKRGWQRLLDKHKGYLPLSIKAVPEGTVVNKHNVLVTVENTDHEFPWLTNFVETVLLQVWYPISVATLGFEIKKLIGKYADVSSDVGVSPFHLNDFGFRGSTCVEAAEIGGSAHLINFNGTDTLVAGIAARRYYDAPRGCGKSVMATEHSTTTIWGRENELLAYRHFIEQCPEGILSVVSDSYNIWKAIDMFGTILKQEILNRGQQSGFARFVVRPDGGVPHEVALKVIEQLDRYFGHTVNSKGYKVLHPKVGVIYGDGIDYHSIKQILQTITDKGYSTDCIVFGSGGAILQKMNRDTHRFAFKCCAALRNNVWVDVYKSPIDSPDKNSKRGRLALVHSGASNLVYSTMAEKDVFPQFNQLVEIFRDGRFIQEWTWDQIKSRIPSI